jgi:hypothetical protein
LDQTSLKCTAHDMAGATICLPYEGKRAVHACARRATKHEELRSSPSAHGR